jgi:hypothetical protein
MGESRLASGGREHRWIRVGSVAGLTAATAGLVVSQPWDAGHRERFVAVSVVLLVVLVVHLVAVVRLTAQRARVAASTLLAGVVASVAVTAGWILPRLSGFPDGAAGAMVAIEGACVFAAGVAGYRTRDLGQAALAGLWSVALSAYLVFAGTLLTFALVADSVPDTQGRAVLPTATAAQRLAENRMQAPDGYLVLLVLSCVLSLVVCAVVPMTRRGTLTVPADRALVRRGPAGRSSASGVHRR